MESPGDRANVRASALKFLGSGVEQLAPGVVTGCASLLSCESEQPPEGVEPLLGTFVQALLQAGALTIDRVEEPPS